MKLTLILWLIVAAQSYSLCTNNSINSCFPCPNECSSCSSQSQCLGCEIQFFYTNASGGCIACPENCLFCTSNTICLTCMNPYVLANQTCSLCVIQYAASCSTTVSASSCQLGYYLSDNYCYSCLLNCRTCSSAYDCSGCATGYYLNTSIITCNPCPQGCTTCNQYTPTQCTSCSNGYMLSSNTCYSVSCSILNCLYCSNSSFCSFCESTYYWDGTACSKGASITCEKGANGQLPTDCVNSCSSFAFANPANSTNFFCKPYASIYVGSVEYHQYYFYAYNHLTQLNALAGSNASLIAEQNGEFSFPLNGQIKFSSVPNYYRLQLAVKLVAANGTTLNISASTPTGLQQIELHTIQPASRPSGVIINSTVVHSNNLIISSNISFNIVQLRIRLWKCTAGCTVCLNQQLCQLCDDPKFMLSYSCVSNCSVYIHFLPNRTCLTTCPPNYYETLSNGLKYCQACVSPCAHCTNSSFCLSCVAGYYYYSYACLTTCPSGYYPDSSSSVCAPCISPCKSCKSQTVCLSCSQGFWNGTSCSNSCPSGQFGDTTISSCLACDTTCLTCIKTAATCTSCNLNFIFYQGQCLTACPSRYYNSGSICLGCVPPCYTCKSSLDCLSCSYNYLLNYSCLSSCPGGYYQDETALICQACLSTCFTCNGPNSCTSCANGCLYFGSCLDNCPTGHYFPRTLNSSCTCQQCVYPCDTCSNEYTCLSCLQGYFYQGGCLTECPSGFYANSFNESCTACNSSFSHCLTCLFSGCSQCQSDFYLFGGSCQSSCPQFYYPQNQICLSCVAPCLTCKSSQICTSCISPYALSGNLCLVQCSSSAVAININSSLVCLPCTSPCISCTSSQSNCTYCLFGYYLYNNTCLNNCSSVGNAFSYYAELATLTCQSCGFPCLTCSSETWCLSCKIGYLNMVTGVCSQCSLGTYSMNSSCVSCPLSCTICYSFSFCTACAQGYYLLNNNCISNASLCAISGYYVAGRVCYPCLQPCKTCWISSANCTSCLQGYIFYSPSSCLSDCPSGFFNLNQTCLVCSIQCNKCISQPNYCITCSVGYLLLASSSQCLISCPLGTYQSGTSCSTCQYPCLACISQAACVSCVSGVLSGNQCYSSCLSGYFTNSSLMCQICTSPCKQCISSSVNCTQCITGYWLLKNSCISTCPMTYFSQAESGQCLKCVGLCQGCSSYVNCTSCISGYILFYSKSNQVGQCITKCPSNYYLLNNSCLTCPSQCQTCFDATACITCSNNMFQFNGTCFTTCPSGMYSLGGICHKCSFPCENCTDAYTCTSCPQNYLLVGSSECVPGPNCPSGFYLDTSSTRCDSKCGVGLYNLLNYTCSNYSCGLQAFKGADMQCYLNCPSGFLANQSLYCVACNNCDDGLFFTLSSRIIRDSVYLYLLFTETPVYKMNPKVTLTPNLPFESNQFQQNLIAGNTNYSASKNITFLLPLTYSVGASFLNFSFEESIQTFSNPLQKSYATLEFQGYDYYPPDLPNLSSLSIIAIFCSLMGLIKNPFMTDFAQTLFFLGLLDAHYPRHLASFFEGCSLAHFHHILTLDQPGCIGQGKFMYLTGTGFISNTFSNWIIIISILLLAACLYFALWVCHKRLSFSRVHQQTQNQENNSFGTGCISLLEKSLSDFKIRWINRIIYFNYSIFTLFILTQLGDFKSTPGINLGSFILSILILPILIIYPISLRTSKPKYTFLYLRKLLISAAVFLSTQDAIYAVGIISVCNIATTLLILTYKMQKYRWETRFLAIGQLLQLLILIFLSLFIMIGQGNQTKGKITLCWIVAGGSVALLLLYLIHSCFQIFVIIYSWIKEKDFRQNWIKNKEVQQFESHHSESAEQTIKQVKQKQQSVSNEHIQTLLNSHPLDPAGKNILPQSKKAEKNNYNGDFWAYEDSQAQNGSEKGEKVLPTMLVRCVNEFSDYNSVKQQ